MEEYRNISNASYLGKLLSSFRCDRQCHDDKYDLIAEYVDPEHARFKQYSVTDKTRKSYKDISDSTAIYLVDSFARFILQNVSSPASDWLEVVSKESLIRKNKNPAALDIKEMYEDVGYDLRDVFRNSPRNLYTSLLKVYRALSAFGYGTIYSREVDNAGSFAFEYVPPFASWFSYNSFGEVDSFARLETISSRVAMDRFGDANHKTVKTTHNDISFTDSLEFYHIVIPTKNTPAPFKKFAKFKYHAFWYDASNNHVVDVRGMNSFPYHVFWWEKLPLSPYGISPAEKGLPHIINANVKSQLGMQAIENGSVPVLLAKDEQSLYQATFQSGEVVYNGLDSQGNPTVQPLFTGSQNQLIRQELEFEIEKIKEAFFEDTLLNNTQAQATATEASIKEQIRVETVSTFMIVVENSLKSIATRVIDRRREAGIYDEIIPDRVLESIENKELTKKQLFDNSSIVFNNLLAKAQARNEANANVQTLPVILQYAQAEPDVLLKFKLADMAVDTAQGFGVSPKYVRDEEEYEELKELQQQAMQQQQQLEQLQTGGDGMRQVAHALEAVGRDEERRANA